MQVLLSRIIGILREVKDEETLAVIYSFILGLVDEVCCTNLKGIAKSPVPRMVRGIFLFAGYLPEYLRSISSGVAFRFSVSTKYSGLKGSPL